MNQEQLIKKFGNPLTSAESRLAFEKQWMELWNYPPTITEAIPVLGKSVYINKLFRPVWEKFLLLLIQRGLHKEIHTNDQCFMPRYIRGLESEKAISIHTWACAADLNPSDNPLGVSREKAILIGLKPFSEQFQQAARDAGLTPGIDFGRKDGMHFEFTNFTL